MPIFDFEVAVTEPQSHVTTHPFSRDAQKKEMDDGRDETEEMKIKIRKKVRTNPRRHGYHRLQRVLCFGVQLQEEGGDDDDLRCTGEHVVALHGPDIRDSVWRALP